MPPPYFMSEAVFAQSMHKNSGQNGRKWKQIFKLWQTTDKVKEH